MEQEQQAPVEQVPPNSPDPISLGYANTETPCAETPWRWCKTAWLAVIIAVFAFPVGDSSGLNLIAPVVVEVVSLVGLILAISAARRIHASHRTLHGLRVALFAIVMNLTVGGLCLLFQVTPSISLPGSSALVVDVAEGWEQVRITSEDNLKSPLVFNAPAKQIRVEKIGYGPYHIEIRYKDKKTLWLEYYHIDQDFAQTIAVRVKREAGAGKAMVETTCIYRWRRPTLDFSGEVVIDETGEKMETGEKRPRRIGGGP